MEPVVYIDIVFLDNLFMNFIILYITSIFVKKQKIIWRMLAGACLGALYALAVVLFNFTFLSNVFIKIVVSIAMIAITYKYSGVKEFFRLVLVMYCITFALGGAAFALYSWGSDAIEIAGGIYYIKSYPVKLLLYSSVVILAIVNIIIKYIYTRVNNSNNQYRLRVEIDGDSIDVNALMDTGNTLYEPVTGYPVIIIELDRIKHIMPVNIQRVYEKTGTDVFLSFNDLGECEWTKRLRYIPYSALGNKNGCLVGFRPDKLIIEKEKTCIRKENVYIAIYNSKLTNLGNYHALIHPEILGDL